MEKQRLSKLMAAAGVASRRHCEEIIFEGRVKVNGHVIKLPQTMVDPFSDRITIDGSLLPRKEEKFYIMLNKPKGFICSHDEKYAGKRVVDIFHHLNKRIFTLGRLDRDTTGLLIVTNDGHFAHNVIHPSANITKEYLVKVNKELTHEHLIELGKGTRVEGVFVKPSRVTKVRRNTVKITVKEGKKHEVRRLIEAAGLETVSLERIRIGGLQLGSLREGEWRPLTENDKDQLVGKKE